MHQQHIDGRQKADWQLQAANGISFWLKSSNAVCMSVHGTTLPVKLQEGAAGLPPNWSFRQKAADDGSSLI
jgi:hypothetical protein